MLSQGNEEVGGGGLFTRTRDCALIESERWGFSIRKVVTLLSKGSIRSAAGKHGGSVSMLKAGGSARRPSGESTGGRRLSVRQWRRMYSELRALRRKSSEARYFFSPPLTSTLQEVPRGDRVGQSHKTLLNGKDARIIERFGSLCR